MTYETNQVKAIVTSITTEMVAQYIYTAIYEVSNEYNFEDVSDVENYLDSTIDAISRDGFYHQVLSNTYYSLANQVGYDYFDDEEAIKEYAVKNDLYILDSDTLIDDVSNEELACRMAFELLQEVLEEEGEEE